MECSGSSLTCETQSGSVDGPGIADSDVVIYVSTSLADGVCGGDSSTIAFANSCQLESTLDRYNYYCN